MLEGGIRYKTAFQSKSQQCDNDLITPGFSVLSDGFAFDDIEGYKGVPGTQIIGMPRRQGRFGPASFFDL